MMFRPVNRLASKAPVVRHRHARAKRFIGAVLSAALSALAGAAVATAGERTAVIPVTTIYPGQLIDQGQLQVVDVTNPDLAGDYASSFDQVVGKITNRTLLAGRVIFVGGLREPYAVERGKAVRIVYSNGPLTITAGGAPLDNAAVGDLIRIRNTDSGLIVSGTVMSDGTVHVVAQ